MLKKLTTTLATVTMALFLVTACAEEGKDTGSTTARTSTDKEKATDSGNQAHSLMNQPVNFSTPEDVEKTLQNIREKEGGKAYNQLKNAMQYLMVYDLSVGNNEEKLYKKLNGRTPEQIIAKMKR
jgi:succinate dehydrogenase/fumarate reductase flavoprotein subunit